MAFYPRSQPHLDLNQVKKKIMDLLARRDHTLKELRKKLKDRTDPKTLDLALSWAEQQNWIPSDEKITEQLVRSLRLKKKGASVINNKLKEVGLQPVTPNEEDELETALTALTSKFTSDFLSQKEYKNLLKSKAKVMRFLVNRGFSPFVAQKASKIYFSREKDHTFSDENQPSAFKEKSSGSDDTNDSFLDLNYSNEDE